MIDLGAVHTRSSRPCSIARLPDRAPSRPQYRTPHRKRCSYSIEMTTSRSRVRFSRRACQQPTQS
eukprot:2006715-Rhodomonas_salina.1